MFFQYYKMTGLPFAESIIPQEMLSDQRFVQCLERLDYFIHDGCAAMLTGATGLGKSSLLRLFVSRLPANRYQPLYFNLTNMPSVSLLRSIVTALGEKPKLGKDRLFAQIRAKTSSSDRITLLLIDEAHLLAEDALTDLRLLLSSGLEGQMRVKIVLAGQEALRHMLLRKNLADLINRMAVRYEMAPLSKDQTACYIDHRVKNAGGSEKIFDKEAKQQIHDYAGGVPRMINNLATICLIHGAAKKQNRIDVTTVNHAAGELRLL